MVRRRTKARKKRTAYQGLGTAPARRGGAWVILVLGALVVVNLYVFVWDQKSGVRAIRQQAEAKGMGTGTPAMAIPAAPLAPLPAAAVITADAALPAPAPAVKTIDGKVGKSETIGKMLKRVGLTAAEADEIIRTLSGTLDFRTVRAGESFQIERGGDGRVTRFELDLGKGKHAHVERKPSGELSATLE